MLNFIFLKQKLKILYFNFWCNRKVVIKPKIKKKLELKNNLNVE